MPDSRISVTIAELSSNISIWLTVVGQRQAWMLRDIWSRRGEEYDAAKILRARRELSQHLAQRILNGGHELTRTRQQFEPSEGDYTPNGRAEES